MAMPPKTSARVNGCVIRVSKVPSSRASGTMRAVAVTASRGRILTCRTTFIDQPKIEGISALTTVHRIRRIKGCIRVRGGAGHDDDVGTSRFIIFVIDV